MFRHELRTEDEFLDGKPEVRHFPSIEHRIPDGVEMRQEYRRIEQNPRDDARMLAEESDCVEGVEWNPGEEEDDDDDEDDLDCLRFQLQLPL